MYKKLFFAAFLSIVAINLTGCTVIFQSGRQSDVKKIEKLEQQLDELNQAKKLLEERLSKEIEGNQVRLEMMEKGLVITFLSDVLFDSGKAKVKPQAATSLDQVVRVLKENVPDLNVGIEGHTDNQPIKHSSWKSNWELSTARALSVLHYLVDQKEIAPERVSAIGYGEYHPVASNDNKEGRQLNRRVEIVIIPQLKKQRESQEDAAVSPAGNLK
jgi:chemotaxis protein MotB